MDICFKFHSTSVLPLLMTLVLITGCRGSMGPSGKDVEGVDVTPPTVHLISPTPLSEAWDELVIRAVAVDNVAIQEVRFYIDGGNIIDGELLSTFETPYEKTINIKSLEPGWHYIIARAVDTGNNITDTPEVPVMLGFSASLRDTISVRYHNSVYANTWVAPDSLKTTAYWSRFSVARQCTLTEVSMMIGAVLSDTAAVSIQIWSGEEFPVEMDTAFTIAANRIDTVLTWQSISMRESQHEDFFVLLTLMNNSPEDTLMLGGDSGDPPWGRAGSRDDGDYYYLPDRFSTANNFLIGCKLYYVPVAD